MQTAITKAKILMEALPYIRTFSNKTFVIKFGGNAMVDSALSESFAQDIVLLSYVGIRPVIVHGGGPQIDELMARLGKQAQFIDGLRVTDQETVNIVEMVLVGKINKEIVGHINRNGGRAVGLSGKDGNMISARKLLMPDKRTPSRTIDLGMVGEITAVNPRVIKTLDADQFIPVIAPLAAGEDGLTYNINADTAAGEIAAALQAEKLILLTDVAGVQDSTSTLLSTITNREAEELIRQGAITGGMIPKITCCCRGLEQGVAKAHIIDGRVEHAVLLEIFTDFGIGTELIRA